MYYRYKDIPTRSQYKRDLKETRAFMSSMVDYLEPEFFLHITRQLDDVIERLPEFEKGCDNDEVNERYDFGSIALKWLNEDSEEQLRLVDAFWGLLHLAELK